MGTDGELLWIWWWTFGFLRHVVILLHVKEYNEHDGWRSISTIVHERGTERKQNLHGQSAASDE
jgi:hypothetical protein